MDTQLLFQIWLLGVILSVPSFAIAAARAQDETHDLPEKIGQMIGVMVATLFLAMTWPWYLAHVVLDR
jgi:hypothetical protein